MVVRPLESEDLDGVVARVASTLSSDATRNPLINPSFSHEEFAFALESVRDHTWVALDDRGLVGHLYAALLENVEHGLAAWIGPDGVSFDDGDVLAALYAEAAARWIERGALDHFAWVRDDEDATRPWFDLGFARAHARGVLELKTRPRVSFADGYQLRRGDLGDLDVALAFDRILDAAQRRGPSFLFVEEPENQYDEWRELLWDVDVHHYLVDFAGEPVAQCVTYPLPPQRASFPDTLHLSAVVVAPAHEHRGVARAMLDEVLTHALDEGFRYAEASWRVTNRRAARFWRRYGLHPTYVRLQRTIARA